MRISAYNSTASTTYTLTEVKPNKPYLEVSNSYLPLTTNTSQGVRMKIQSGTNSYRPMVYTTASLESDYYTSSTNQGHMSSTTALTTESISTTTYGTQVTKTGEEYKTQITKTGEDYRTQVTKTSETYETASSSSSKESYTYTTSQSNYTVPEWVTSRSDYTVAQTVTRESDYTVPQTVTSRSDYQTVVTVTSETDYRTTIVTANKNVVSHPVLASESYLDIRVYPEYSSSVSFTYYGNQATITQFESRLRNVTSAANFTVDMNAIKYGDRPVEVVMQYTNSRVWYSQVGDEDRYSDGTLTTNLRTNYVDTYVDVNTNERISINLNDTVFPYIEYTRDNEIVGYVQMHQTLLTAYTTTTSVVRGNDGVWHTNPDGYGISATYGSSTYFEAHTTYGTADIATTVDLTGTRMSSSAYDVTHTEMTSSAYNTTIAVNTSSAYDVTVAVNTSSAYNTTIPVNTSSAYDTTITASGSTQYTVTTKTVDLTAVTTTSTIDLTAVTTTATIDLTAVTTTHTGYETRESTSGYTGVSSSSYSKTTWM